MIRILVYPNITFNSRGQDIEKDSYVQVINKQILLLNEIRNEGFTLKDILSKIFLVSKEIEIFFTSKSGSIFLKDFIRNFLIITI